MYTTINTASISQRKRFHFILRIKRAGIFGTRAGFQGICQDDPLITGIASHSGERKIWFPTGTLRSVEQYRNGKLHGVCKKWYPDGTQASLSHYAKGVDHGTYAWWNEKGELKTLYKFSHGERIDTATSWYETITDTSQIDESMFIWNDIPPVTYDSAKKILATRQIMNQTIFDKHGREISDIWWYRTGIPKWTEIWYDKAYHTICVDFNEAGEFTKKVKTDE